MTQATQARALNAFVGADTPFPPLMTPPPAPVVKLGDWRRWRVEFTEAGGQPLVWTGFAADSAEAVKRAGRELAEEFPGFSLDTARVVVCVEVL